MMQYCALTDHDIIADLAYRIYRAKGLRPEKAWECWMLARSVLPHLRSDAAPPLFVQPPSFHECLQSEAA